MKRPDTASIFQPALRTHGLFTIVGLLSFACTPGDGSESWTGTVDTLANGVVQVLNTGTGLWKDGQGWSLVPEVSIGEVEGNPAAVFAAVTGLEADDQGRIYVLDRQANELRIFSPEGEHLGSAGRAGDGPGEYRNANGLEWLPPDSLVVVDQRGNRYSVLTRNGDYVRSVPRNLGFYSWAFRGSVWDGRVFELSFVRQGEEYLPALLSTSLRSKVGEPAGERLGEEPESARVDTLMLPRPDEPMSEGFSIRTERGGMTMGVPFAPSAVYHLDNTGHLWHGHGSEFRILRSTLEGDTILDIRLDAEAVPVSQEEVEAWEAGPGPQQFREMGGDLDLGRIPSVKPFFDGLYRDPDGFLWVSIPTRSQETGFALFDPRGRYLGRLGISGFDGVEWIDPVVRDGRLYLVGRDDLDVQRVHVFRIER